MNEKIIYMAGGCFWGTEKLFQAADGVLETTVGYANGHTANPTYKEVCTETTGYRETVEVRYDADTVSLQTLLGIFFLCIDPTVTNRQGEDIGSQYQTGVYYTDEESRKIIEEYFAKEREKHERFCTELAPLQVFYPAEEYHQDYLIKNPEGYCHISLHEMQKVKEFLEAVKGERK